MNPQVEEIPERLTSEMFSALISRAYAGSIDIYAMVSDHEFDFYSKECPMPLKRRMFGCELWKQRGSFKLKTCMEQVKNRDDLAFVVTQVRDVLNGHGQTASELFDQWLTHDVNTKLTHPFRPERFKCQEMRRPGITELEQRILNSDLHELLNPKSTIDNTVLGEAINLGTIFLACMKSWATSPGATRWHSLRVGVPGGATYSMEDAEFEAATGKKIADSDVGIALSAQDISQLKNFGKTSSAPLEANGAGQTMGGMNMISCGPTQIFCKAHERAMVKAHAIQRQMDSLISKIAAGSGLTEDRVLDILDARLNFYLDENAKRPPVPSIRQHDANHADRIARAPGDRFLG